MVDAFVLDIGRLEPNLEKRRAIYELQLSKEEWKNTKNFLDLLAVSFFCICLVQIADHVLFVKHADNAQQAFSSDNVSTLHLALPALEALHSAWTSRVKREKYVRFKPALEAGLAKIEEYYERTGLCDAYLIAMCMFFSR